MPIDPDFPKNHQANWQAPPHRRGAFSFCMGPGGRAAEATENEEVKSAYQTRGEEMPL